jgi:peptidoglycan hydrolase CwlO-like protein
LIQKLDELNRVSSVYVSRVVESYKRRDPSPLVLLASSDSLSNYLSKKKYLSVIKARDRLILGEMTSAKQDYDAQKEAKIIKQKQIKDLKDKLLVQQQNLSAQQKSKKDLLILTANS